MAREFPTESLNIQPHCLQPASMKWGGHELSISGNITPISPTRLSGMPNRIFIRCQAAWQASFSCHACLVVYDRPRHHDRCWVFTPDHRKKTWKNLLSFRPLLPWTTFCQQRYERHHHIVSGDWVVTCFLLYDWLYSSSSEYYDIICKMTSCRDATLLH